MKRQVEGVLWEFYCDRCGKYLGTVQPKDSDTCSSLEGCIETLSERIHAMETLFVKYFDALVWEQKAPKRPASKK